MPNPPPPPPPHQPTPGPSTLRKFSLIQSPPPNAPILSAINSAGPLPAADLQQLRGSLVLSRMLAADRLSTRDQNRAQLADRQAQEKRMAEEAARTKEGERRRRREDEEKKERERMEKAEREGAEREKEERKRAKLAEKEEQERRTAEQKAKEKQKAVEVLSLVHANEANKRNGADGDGDVSMGDATPTPYASTPSSAFPTPPPQPVPKKSHKASRVVASSPEADEDGQPKPPRHHEKKKRKRDQVIDSDASESETADQPLLQKLRKGDSQTSSDFRPSPSFPLAGPSASTPAVTLPPPPEPTAHIERRLKEERFQKHSIPIKPPPPGGASAFFIPSTSLVPPKPPVIPPVPTAKRQADVSGDFSNAKPGQQIAHSTFQNWVDAYLRPFGEDDLAFLAPKPEDIAPYLIPPLGRHYLDKWEEEDAELPGGPSHLSHAHNHHTASPLEPPPLPRLRPDALTEDALAMENVFLGPLSERLMAALAVDGGPGMGGDEDEGEALGNGASEGEEGAVPPKLQMDAVELEERIKRELRFIGLLPEEEVDWSAREDDEISSALRACQRLLHHQTELNESRKAVLMSLVKDRMAYQDYETARDAQERVVEQGWTKRTRVDTKKQKKKKDRDRGKPGTSGTKEGGAGDDPTKQPIPRELLEAVEKRGRLVQAFEPFFGEEEKGRFFGLPEKSVYEGLEVGEQDDDEDEPQQLGGPAVGPSLQ
ncbi:hypothetical protein JCM11251_006393 [Rhodosporidiobolus azoricus]